MTDMTRAALGALVAAVLLAGCAAPSPDRGGPAHWSYSGEAGPDRWGALHPDYALCARGRAGSPIDIATAEPANLPAIGFDYRPGPGEVLDNGHSIQVDLPAAGQARFASGQYRLAQFHFHAPSEERFAGRAYPLGVHLVHSDAAGRLAVVAVLFREGAPNPVLDQVFGALPVRGGRAPLAAPVDPRGLLPAARSYYTYEGSLTTPPCTEGVAWHVLQTPVEASRAQIDAFRARYPMNARPVQPLHGRTVKQGG